MNFVFFDTSSVCSAVAQLRKNPGVPVSMVMFIIWLSFLVNAYSDFFCCDLWFLRLSIFDVSVFFQI